jgi:hypothetical protein
VQVSGRLVRQEIRDAANEGFKRLKLDKGKSIPKKVLNAMIRFWSEAGEPSTAPVTVIQ